MGKKAQEIMNRGDLVPDDIMVGIIKERFSKPDSVNGFILDGFPRTAVQAEALDKLLEEINIDHISIVNISADEEELINRLGNRRACKECGKIFSLETIEGLNKCSNCGAENSFYLREDDKVEVIRNRLEIFKSSTKPVLDYYKDKRKIVTINGSGTIDEINESILTELEN
jgi:adenylate kinase